MNLTRELLMLDSKLNIHRKEKKEGTEYLSSVTLQI